MTGVGTRFTSRLQCSVFGHRPGAQGSIPGRVILKTQKIVLNASLLNTRDYGVLIKDKME